MGTIYATTPLLRSPPVPSTPGRKSSIEKGGLWLASPTNEQSALALSVSSVMMMYYQLTQNVTVAGCVCVVTGLYKGNSRSTNWHSNARTNCRQSNKESIFRYVATL